MFERSISADDIVRAIEVGETIENYPEDTPYPSRLLLAWVARKPLHVVLADNRAAGEITVITAYRPDPKEWDASFRKRSRP